MKKNINSKNKLYSSQSSNQIIYSKCRPIFPSHQTNKLMEPQITNQQRFESNLILSKGVNYSNLLNSTYQFTIHYNHLIARQQVYRKFNSPNILIMNDQIVKQLKEIQYQSQLSKNSVGRILQERSNKILNLYKTLQRLNVFKYEQYISDEFTQQYNSGKFNEVEEIQKYWSNQKKYKNFQDKQESIKIINNSSNINQIQERLFSNLPKTLQLQNKNQYIIKQNLNNSKIQAKQIKNIYKPKSNSSYRNIQKQLSQISREIKQIKDKQSYTSSQIIQIKNQAIKQPKSKQTSYLSYFKNRIPSIIKIQIKKQDKILKNSKINQIQKSKVSARYNSHSRCSDQYLSKKQKCNSQHNSSKIKTYENKSNSKQKTISRLSNQVKQATKLKKQQRSYSSSINQLSKQSTITQRKPIYVIAKKKTLLSTRINNLGKQ